MIDLATALAAQGYRVDVIFSRPVGPYLTQVPAPVKTIVLQAAPGGVMYLRQLLARDLGSAALPAALLLGGVFRYLLSLVQYLQQEHPAVLISGKTSSNLAALWARRLAGAASRLIVCEHTNLSQEVNDRVKKGHWHWRLVPRVVGRMYPWADAIVAVSDGVADDLSYRAAIPRERVVTIYNPTITPAVLQQAQQPLAHPWFRAGAPPVVLGGGRLVAQKDFVTLLKAFARVRAVRDVRLVILGEGNKRAELETVARKLGVAAEVEMPGYVDNPFPYMVRAAAFALSSTHEGLPGVLIQALACGCPVVSTDCPSGPREILQDGRYGRLVAVGDDAALAQALLLTLDESPDRDKLRTRAAQFSAKRAADRYLDICVGGKRAASVRDESTSLTMCV
jgi:glycosyltransferase involved in cell wall biosynthesis